MPKGPQGQKRRPDTVANAIRVTKIRQAGAGKRDGARRAARTAELSAHGPSLVLELERSGSTSFKFMYSGRLPRL
jgi:hypothetical protein